MSEPEKHQREISGHGAIATSNYHATEAGSAVLRAGGNAIDAAITAAATLCVVYPNQVSIGGDLVALVRSPAGQVHFVNATGPAPAAASLEQMRAKHGSKLPRGGVDTITLPGAAAGWEALDTLGGTLSWGERLAEAIHLSGKGAPVALSVARASRREHKLLSADPGAAETFLPGGRPLQEGQIFRQPALADSLERISIHGPGDLYTGELGRTWINGLQRLGSEITEEDAAAYSAVVEEPLSAEAFGLTVHTGGPNTQGFCLLRTLQALHGDANLSPTAERLTRLFHQANLVRDTYLTDPAVLPFSTDELLTVPAPQFSRRLPEATGDTVGLSVLSADGWAVSLVQSVFQAFGSAVLEPESGIHFQNRGTSFSLDPDHPAALAPGRRPPHTLMPVLVEQDMELKYVLATMGGQAQAQVHVHLLLKLLAGASPLEATSAPRWIVDPRAATETTEAGIIAEIDIDTAQMAQLESCQELGLAVLPPRSEKLGHANVIEALPDGTLKAASDPRSEGSSRLL